MSEKLSQSYFISAVDFLESKKIPLWDFHIHTIYTDGKASINQVFEKAIKKGLEVIIFTEHTEKWRTSNKNWFLDYCSEIEKNKVKYSDKIKAFIGLEANAITFDGQVEMTDEMKSRVEFVLGAAHRYPSLENIKVKELSKEKAIELEYLTLMGLAESKEIDSIAHIGATCTKYCTPFPNSLTREIIKTATKNKIAVEANPIYHKPLANFIEMCAEENALITFGSNAHGFNDIGLIVKELKNIFK